MQQSVLLDAIHDCHFPLTCLCKILEVQIQSNCIRFQCTPAQISRLVPAKVLQTKVMVW